MVSGLLAYTFYRNITVFLVMLPVGSVVGIAAERQTRMARRKRALSGQFKESMMILAGLFSAGYSVENALAASIRELTTLYGSDGLITREFESMVQWMRMNRTVEQALDDFAQRSGLEEIRSFSEVFSVAKRSSGDLGSIMRHTAEVIRDRMQVQEEIVTMTASRRFEQKIMNLIPFFIVFYIDGASPGFFDQMYETGAGRFMMTICLVVYLISYVAARKILEIEI
ncbi:MAG: type II secretion system F family protein [Clostridiales bacterium]|nr:type II secretion system F family protein [Clostridiales bacterium]